MKTDDLAKENQVYPLPFKNDSGYQLHFLEGVGSADAPVLLVITLVLQTAFLRSCNKPISLLLLGRPGIGKSRLLSPLAKLDFVSYVNDITPKYVVEFLRKVERGDKKFLVIPDFTNCMSHGKSTRTTLIAILRSMTEEGVKDLSDYHLEFKADSPVRAGLITATTLSSYQQFKRDWKSTGYLSRLLPFSFSHSIATTTKIMDDIDSRRPDLIDSVKLEIRKRPKEVKTPDHLLRQLRVYEELLSKSTDSLPYRHQIQLNAVTESLAVVRGHSEVTQEDIDTVAWLSKWINYDFKEI